MQQERAARLAKLFEDSDDDENKDSVDVES